MIGYCRFATFIFGMKKVASDKANHTGENMLRMNYCTGDLKKVNISSL